MNRADFVLNLFKFTHIDAAAEEFAGRVMVKYEFSQGHRRKVPAPSERPPGQAWNKLSEERRNEVVRVFYETGSRTKTSKMLRVSLGSVSKIIKEATG